MGIRWRSLRLGPVFDAGTLEEARAEGRRRDGPVFYDVLSEVEYQELLREREGRRGRRIPGLWDRNG